MRATLLCSGLLLGLSAGVAQAAPPEADAQIDDLHEMHRHHQHGGITQFIALSLDTLGEDQARRPRVEELQADLNTCLESAEEVEGKALEAVAEGVAAGAVDAAKVKALAEQLTGTADPIHACVAGLLNQLHATLTAPERAELGAKVLAHWQVWRHVNHDADPAGREPGSRLAHLAKDLSLSPEQLEKLSAALKTAFAGNNFDAAPVQKHVEAFAAAFAGEQFDATKVTTGSTAYLTSQGLLRVARFYETAAPLLKPEQRATLAVHLREHAHHHAAAAAGAQP